MKCYICDKTLTELEVQWNKDLEEWEPCGTCLEIALDAAYSGDFETKEEGEEQTPFGSGAVDTLDSDTYRSYYDHCDAYQSSPMGEDEYG